MMKKEGYRVVKVYIKVEKYERLTQLKIIGGRTMSEVIDDALDRGSPPR